MRHAAPHLIANNSRFGMRAQAAWLLKSSYGVRTIVTVGYALVTAAAFAACASTKSVDSSDGGGSGDHGGSADASVSDGIAPPPGDDATVGDDARPPSDDAALIQALLELTKTCSGNAVVSTHTYSTNHGSPVDVCKLSGAVYYTAKMAIDCDGRTTTHCPGSGADKDCCYYNDTSFHNKRGEPLAAEFDRYVVIPIDFKYPGLDQTNGGNVVAVIYKGQLEFAVFGDQGPKELIGEASYRTAETFGINPSPARGGVDGDVTYVVFVGAGTQPSDIEDADEIAELGHKLALDLVSKNH